MWTLNVRTRFIRLSAEANEYDGQDIKIMERQPSEDL